MRIECRRYFYYPTILSVILAAVFSLAACTKPEKIKAEHLAKGQAFLKDSRFQEASIEFRPHKTREYVCVGRERTRQKEAS
jgi:hypothetical protein